MSLQSSADCSLFVYAPKFSFFPRGRLEEDYKKAVARRGTSEVTRGHLIDCNAISVTPCFVS